MNKSKELKIKWSKKENDLMIHYPKPADGYLAYNVLCSDRQRYDWIEGKVIYDKSFVDELEARGYDIMTLKFSVKRKVVDKEN